MSDTTTRGIRVQVASFYDAERSAPQERYYFFAYQVRISNVGGETAQLISREWVITDGNGEVREVEGPGVVGEQPVLDPGAVHRYTSGAILKTPIGSMEGTYEMHEAGGRVFQARIPRFRLQRPGVLQ